MSCHGDGLFDQLSLKNFIENLSRKIPNLDRDDFAGFSGILFQDIYLFKKNSVLNINSPLSAPSDDVFLLQFLRTRKYMMDKVFHTFEHYINAQKKYAKWFDIQEKDNERMMKLYHAGYIYPLAERDEDGKRIVLIQLKRLDPEYFTSADAIR